MAPIESGFGPALLAEGGLAASRVRFERRAARGEERPARTPTLTLTVASPRSTSAPQPVTVGLPFPKGSHTDLSALALIDPHGRRHPIQTAVLARWSDGSVKWLLLDSLLAGIDAGRHDWTLGPDPSPGIPEPAASMLVLEQPGWIEVDTDALRLRLNRRGWFDLGLIQVQGRAALEDESYGMILTDGRGRRRRPWIERAEVESRGPVRTTVRLTGRFSGRVRCRWSARLSLFAGTGLLRLDWTLHNPERARHPAGLWDLGDPGSFFFRDLSFGLVLSGRGDTRIGWTAQSDESWHPAAGGDLGIEQASSGGENWRSLNHVNRHGRVPLPYRGYRVRTGIGEYSGLRASPVVAMAGDSATLTAALPEFWQQFPKAIEASGRTLSLRLFPASPGDLFELQGGERKTHTLWLHVGPEAEPRPEPLEWVHRPARVQAAPEWQERAGAIPRFMPAADDRDDRLATILAGALDERTGLAARREVIDEYGWRHFGEVFADHEQEHYDGPRPAVSHYNNQYDLVMGLLWQWLRTGDTRWYDLFEPLARHVIDIDIYHTRRDRAAYNGGLFWFTDHYKHASTCTHRTYSRANGQPGDRSYGGGPSSNHLFSTGLLHAYYVTGNPDARDAVIELADWVVAMDDGRRALLGLIDDAPTGLASMTGTLDYHGPGRGAGNSVQALLNAWLLTGRRAYLDFAETLIRRVIHPAEDVAARNLLDAEKRWSYTVFLVALARYLEIKAEAGELDAMYAYARASLVRYADWMRQHERPYFDRRDELEYPTEAWLAQDLRKANVLYLAAEHVAEPLRAAFLRRGRELSERAWGDLQSHPGRASTRSLALLLVEGTVDAYYERAHVALPMPEPAGTFDVPPPVSFRPQKARVLGQLGTAAGFGRALLRLADVRRWYRAVLLRNR
jgi:hypothetical protein